MWRYGSCSACRKQHVCGGESSVSCYNDAGGGGTVGARQHSTPARAGTCRALKAPACRRGVDAPATIVRLLHRFEFSRDGVQQLCWLQLLRSHTPHTQRARLALDASVARGVLKSLLQNPWFRISSALRATLRHRMRADNLSVFVII